MDKRLVFLGMLAFVALSLSGCATPQRGMTRLEVLTLLLEIDQRDQNGIKPAEKTNLLEGEIALEHLHGR